MPEGQLKIELPPRIQFYRKHPFDRIPVLERDGIRHVFDLLDSLNLYLSSFQSAVALLEFAKTKHSENTGNAIGDTMRERHEFARKQHKELSKLWEWQLIAARDATMTVYHFGTALTAVKSQSARYPTLRANVNAKRIKEAVTAFSNAFPRSRRIRHAIGHIADSQVTVEKARSHQVQGMIAICCLNDRDFWMTFKADSAPAAETLVLGIHSTTSDKLCEIAEIATSAFEVGSDFA
jgi:hypothetical protein